MGRITCKFGGTSLADAGRIERAMAIVRGSPDRRYVVVSAPGKRHAKDRKITDLLLLCQQMAEQEVDIGPVFSEIRKRFLQISADLGVETEIDELIDRVEEGLRAGESRDWVASRGEFLCARIFADALGARFVDAASGIRFTAAGLFDPASYDLLSERLSGDGVVVVPGFYGLDAQGRVRTFSRGGSDITGAIVARAVGAEVYENWTDVSGFLMADPTIVDGARPMEEVTYRELRELSYMGAKVLHDEAVFPVRDVGIPIHIRNTNAPEDAGTRIVATRDLSKGIVVGIAGRKNFTAFLIEKGLMNSELGFGRRLLGILEHQGINFEHLPSGIDTISVIVRDEELDDKAEIILREIEHVLEPDRVEVYSDLAVIATVGEGMAHHVGIAAKLFTALAEAGVNIRMIDQGSSEINIIVAVEVADYDTAVRAIYHAFVE